MNEDAIKARMLQPNGDPYRIAYNGSLKQFRNAPNNTPMFFSSLRSEAVLGVQNTITWNIIANQPNTSAGATTVRSSENRLAQQDAFTVVEWSVMFGNELSAGTKPGSVMLQTWENPATVAVLPATVGGFGANAASLIEAYNSQLSMISGTTQYILGADILGCKRVDTAQAGELVFTASNTAQSYFDGGKFMPMRPYCVLNGKNGATFTLTLPDNTDFTLVASNRVIAVLMLRGLRVQNGAEML